MWLATFHVAHSVTHQQPINIIIIITITIIIIIIINPSTPCYKKSTLGSKQPICGICFVDPDCPNIYKSRRRAPQKYLTCLVYLPFFVIFAQYWPYICLMHLIFGLMTQIFGSIVVKYTIFDIPWPKAFQKYILYWVRMVNLIIIAWPVLCSFPPPTADFGSKLPDQNRSAPSQN